MSGVKGAVAAAAMTASRTKTTVARLVKGALSRAKGAAAAAEEILMKIQITRRQAAATRRIGKSAVFLADPLCVQTYAVCTTCGATRTYAPKGKLQKPNEYADQPSVECRRGVGCDLLQT